MDDIVRQAMAKWPHVPACYGWLGLDARGNWYMRDDRTQAAGDFASGLPGSKGALLQHEKLIDFIARNYAADPQGRWYFQNGPQRVFVELQETPLIWRIHPDGAVRDHCGRPADVRSAWVDERGYFYLAADQGLGLVHTQDMDRAAERVEAGLWTPQAIDRAHLPQRFGYLPSPLRHTQTLHGA